MEKKREKKTGKSQNYVKFSKQKGTAFWGKGNGAKIFGNERRSFGGWWKTQTKITFERGVFKGGGFHATCRPHNKNLKKG